MSFHVWHETVRSNIVARYAFCCVSRVLPFSYVLPIRSARPADPELLLYVARLAQWCEDVIVVDGSAPDVFTDFALRCSDAVRHVPVAADTRGYLNGKVAGVVTGLRLASHQRVIIADDDVRHDAATLRALVEALDEADIVRPQNFFDPLPWHARLDTARMLINRVTGGDWPGTLAVRRATVMRAGGYDGDVMFENLELVRTVRANGGKERVASGLYVRRLPPATAHFFSQRVRQAYDEFARPLRMAVWLAVLPLTALLISLAGWQAMTALCGACVLVAEKGRQRQEAWRIFPVSASLLAPVWMLERGICAWLAIAVRIAFGGVPYRGAVLRRASTSMQELRRRYSA